MAKLIQVPGGTWVDPDHITAVEAHDKDPYHERSRPRVIVRYSPDNCDLGYFPSYDIACIARDELVAVVNATREAKPATATPTDGATT